MTLTPKKLAKLLTGLAHQDASKRRFAAEELAAGDERVIYPLIKALRDENPGVQDAAMRSLMSLGGEVTAYMVLPLLREDAYLRNTAMLILTRIGGEAIPLFDVLLIDKDDDVRKFAIDLICEIGQCDYPEAVARLLVEDPNPNVRGSAAKAMGILQYKEALPQLLSALKDEEWVCFSALEALSILKDEATAQPIAELLNNPSDAIRYAALEALGNIVCPASSKVLLSHLSKAEGVEKTETLKSLVQTGITPSMSEVAEMLMDMLRNGDWDEKLASIKGLSDLQEKKAIHLMVDIAGSLDASDPENEEKLYRIKEALCSFGCAAELINILEDTSIRFRGKAIAIEVIGTLNCKEAVSSLRRLIGTGVRDVKRAGIKAIGEIGDESAGSALIDAIQDEDGHTRKMAVAALGNIGGKEAVAPLLDLLRSEEYTDVIEETVRALIAIDHTAISSHLSEFSSHLKEVIGRHSEDIDTLLSLSEDKDVKVKTAAISGLGKVQEERVYNRLTKALQDEEPEVRKSAIIAMDELNCCHAAIATALKDKDMWVRLYAVKALGHSLIQDSIETLMPMLEDAGTPVVISTINAIAQLGGREAFSVISPLLHHKDEEVRECVRQALENE